MMANWKTCTIGELGTVVGGATPSTKKSENYDDGTISWITPKDLAGFSGRFISRGERNITEQGLKSCSTQLMPAHTVLFSSRAPIGYIAIANREVCTNQGFKSVVPNKDTDYLFLYYLLKNNKDKIENLGSGTTFKEVSGSTMRGIEVSVPDSIEEQRKIASVLSALDNKIEKNTEINENLYQQLFALYDYYYDSAASGEVELGALCQFQEGYVNPAQTHQEYFDGDVKWLRAVDINESFIIETSRTLTQAGFQSAKKSAYLFSPNTIVISKSGTIGRLGIIADYMCGNRAVINIAPKDPLLLPYIYAFLKSHQKEFPNLAVGSVQKNLYVSLLEPLLVRGLSPDALKEFCNAGNAILSTVSNNCQENIRLARLRDTLLPKLLSGELDVSDLDL